MRGVEFREKPRLWGFMSRRLRGLHALQGNALAIAAVCAICSPAYAHTFADGAIEGALEYTVDVVAPLSGERDVHVLDNLEASLSFDMERLAGWQNTAVFVHVLNNSGDAPNDVVATLQGVDNIEVARQSLRLYEFWIERQFGSVNWRTGLYDLNSEFYSTDSAGLLIAPAFGIGSELAATGTNGPSIFPSTALAIRATAEISPRLEFKAAVVNAAAGVLGDPDGVDTSFDAGVLIIGEWSWMGVTRIDVGGWTYTDPQVDIRDVNGAGDPVGRRAVGAYFTIERRIFGAEAERFAATGFVRVGFSDGDTTPFDGGWQSGIHFESVWEGRPNSVLSIGLNQAYLGEKYRRNQRDVGEPAARAESAIEITYADTVGHLTIQPDLQVIRNPGGNPERAAEWVSTLRLSMSF